MQTLETQPEILTTKNTWQLAHELEPGAVEAARQKTRRFIGQIATAQSVEVEPVEFSSNAHPTLLSALKAATEGDSQARESLRINAQTNVAEMLHKAGHQTAVELEISNGHLEQGGKLLADIQANALRYSRLNRIMMERTVQELENVHTFEELLAGGVLDTHDAVVFSLSPEDEQTKQDYGFFEETDTCSIQLLSKQNADSVKLETALVAGKAHPGAVRHDAAAVETLVSRSGGSLQLESSEDSLRQIILVPKGDTINGVSDMVKAYDDAIGGVFYGQNVDGQDTPDYLAHAEACQAKNTSFDTIVDEVVEQLTRETSSITTPTEATKRLHKLTEQALVQRAVADNDIDERVFGQQAAAKITAARKEASSGNTTKSAQLEQQAVELAVASSCPMFGGGSEEKTGKNLSENDPLLVLYGEDKYGSLAFRCPQKNCLNVRSANMLIEQCQHCGASVRC